MEHKTRNISGIKGASIYRRIQRIAGLVSLMLLVSACEGHVEHVKVPSSLTDGDSLFLGATFSYLIQNRNIDHSYDNEGYIEYRRYRFFEKIRYNMSDGYVSGISLTSSRASKADFDSVGMLLQQEYHSAGRKEVAIASGDTAIFRNWKIGPKLYVWISIDCKRNIYPQYCELAFYIGPDGVWEGLPEWKDSEAFVES